MKKINNFLILNFIFCSTSILASPIYFNNNHPEIRITSWKEIRDQNIVKQNLDYSCGSASIATILNGYYNKKVTEQEILKIIDKGDLMASFDDLRKALNTLGFQAKGYNVSLETLQKLKIPVIAYIKYRKNDHFTVISGINTNFVRISDPSLGKRILSRHQFKEMWENQDNDNLKGKILVIIPNNQFFNSEFFNLEVKLATTQAIKYLAAQH